MFFGWWIVVACFVMAFYVGAAVFWGFTAFFEPLVKEFQWSHAQVSFAASLRGLEMGVLAPLVGVLADRYSLRWLLISGVAGVGVGLLILSQTSTLWGFYAAILLLGFGAGGCTSVVHMSLMANWFKRRLGLAMGIMASGFGTSGLAIPFIVDAIDTYGWRPTLIALAVGIWVICLPLGLVIRDRPQDMGLNKDGDPPQMPKAAPDPDKETGQCTAEVLSEVATDFRQSCFSVPFMSLFWAEFIRGLVISAVSLHVMPYLSDVGMDRSHAGLVAAGLPLISVVGRFGFGYLGDIYDKRWIMAIAFIMMSLGLLAFYPLEGKGFVLAVLFMVMFGPGLGGGMVLRASILSECFNPAHFGKLIGLVMAASAGGGIVGPWLAGWYFDSFGDYRPLWLVFSGIVLVSALLLRFIRPLKK